MKFKTNYTSEYNNGDYEFIDIVYNSLDELLNAIKDNASDFIIRYDTLSNSYHLTIADKPLMYFTT